MLLCVCMCVHVTVKEYDEYVVVMGSLPSSVPNMTFSPQADGEHCLLLALPCGRDANDVRAQTHALKSTLVSQSLTFRHKQLTSSDNRYILLWPLAH